jgi:AraC family transcriptional regulator, transcriptional activator of pobA
MASLRPESLEQFYSHKFDVMPETDNNDLGSFDVFNIEDRVITGTTSPTFVRRDFYKIMLFQGKNTFHYGDESIAVEGDTLLFFNPQVPYAYDPLEKGTKGYFCVFREDFFHGTIRFPVKEHPLFSAGSKPVFRLAAEQVALVKDLFLKMAGEKESPFSYKYDLIRAYILELAFYALKLNAALHQSSAGDASTRITRVFMELLERQFPITSPQHRYLLRSPKDFADMLSIHVNSLNRAVKKATGKTSSEHIFERLTGEAKTLLRYTDWSVAEIGFALGFDDPAHFQHFFKKITKVTPLRYRTV